MLHTGQGIRRNPSHVRGSGRSGCRISFECDDQRLPKLVARTRLEYWMRWIGEGQRESSSFFFFLKLCDDLGRGNWVLRVQPLTIDMSSRLIWCCFQFSETPSCIKRYSTALLMGRWKKGLGSGTDHASESSRISACLYRDFSRTKRNQIEGFFPAATCMDDVV